MRLVARHHQHAEIDDVQRVSGRIKTSRGRSLEPAVFQVARGAIRLAAIDGEVVNDAGFWINANNFEADRLEHFSSAGRHVAKFGDERFAGMTEAIVLRGIKTCA